MGIPHLLLHEWNPMAGCDPHQELGIVPPPVFIAPFPYTPHLVGDVLQGVTGTASMTTTVEGNGFKIVQIGSDIGSLIPHVPLPLAPPNLLCLLWTAFSSSKSPFGSFTVHANGKPVAAALEIFQSPQLNCSQLPLPAPLGMAFTWGTVIVDITLKDLLLSVADYLYDVLIDKLLEAVTCFGVAKFMPDLEEEDADVVVSSIVTLIGKATKTPPLKSVDEFRDAHKPSEFLGPES